MKKEIGMAMDACEVIGWHGKRKRTEKKGLIRPDQSKKSPKKCSNMFPHFKINDI